MSNIWNTVLAIIASVGGSGVIIAGIVKFCSNRIADRLAIKYQGELDHALEQYKASLEKKNYISKTRFDMEFSIYGKLSEAFMEMIDATYLLFPSFDQLPLDETKQKEIFINRYEKANAGLVKVQKVLGENAPFIPQEIYASFDEIRKLCVRQFTLYTWCGELSNHKNDYAKSKIQATDECYNRTNEIMQKHDALIAQLRDHLNSLEVAAD